MYDVQIPDLWNVYEVDLRMKFLRAIIEIN